MLLKHFVPSKISKSHASHVKTLVFLNAKERLFNVFSLCDESSPGYGVPSTNQSFLLNEELLVVVWTKLLMQPNQCTVWASSSHVILIMYCPKQLFMPPISKQLSWHQCLSNYDCSLLLSFQQRNCCISSSIANSPKYLGQIVFFRSDPFHHPFPFSLVTSLFILIVHCSHACYHYLRDHILCWFMSLSLLSYAISVLCSIEAGKLIQAYPKSYTNQNNWCHGRFCSKGHLFNHFFSL